MCKTLWFFLNITVEIVQTVLYFKKIDKIVFSEAKSLDNGPNDGFRKLTSTNRFNIYIYILTYSNLRLRNVQKRLAKYFFVSDTGDTGRVLLILKSIFNLFFVYSLSHWRAL